jgi:hypothetical protein
MNYTPRQATAFLVIAEHRRRADLRVNLLVGRLSAHGDERAIREQFREWDS